MLLSSQLIEYENHRRGLYSNKQHAVSSLMESLHTKSSRCCAKEKKKQSRFEHTALHQSDGSKCHSVVCGVINHVFHWELSVCGLCCPDFCSFLVPAHDLLFCWMNVHQSSRGGIDTGKH